ncbi:aminodeoxychorismate synthase component I [Caedibacter taeniospiralis]|uniref:aminodeoxychorismate synthase component I n=1 Tax=Caedibacter taeniospiralis TaxID=28907 RepID=UPI000C27F4ED|nr:aminodeoxychorismate synthase component I [Caedibacter taeniospiralis]
MNHLPEFACLENTLDNAEPSYYFSQPKEKVLCINPDMINDALTRLWSLQQQGLYLVGFVSYETAYYVNPDFFSLQNHEPITHDSGTPLIHFIAFEKCSIQKPSVDTNKSTISKPVINLISDPLTQEQYAADFSVLKQALIDGESYQINYTKRIQLRSDLDSLSLYNELKKQQPVSYSAFLPFSPMQVLSFSPELFFHKKGDCITVKPMKGTSKRFDDPAQDRASYHFLQNDPKNKAENLIIVDLLRNDLARICHTGSIKVTKPFEVEPYKSVYQMTSTICGKVDADIRFDIIIRHLFPCGSITGAPKKRTMEIIQKLEPSRKLYTGCIGYIMPNNDMCFNVAIRTLTRQENLLWECGVGGGFTIQSTQEDEWQEMTTKLNFIKRLYQPDFNLIETMLYNVHGLQSCDLHLERLMHSAQHLHFNIDITCIKTSLLDYCSSLITTSHESYKVRLEVNDKGDLDITHQPLLTKDTTSSIELFISPLNIDSRNPLWQHKTTDQSTRGFYTRTHSKYLNDRPNAELIFHNELQHITESRFYNIIAKINGTLYTPPATDGLLPGIARAKLIHSGKLIERSISVDELKTASKIYLINDVRGKIAAALNTKLSIAEDVN